MNKENLQFANNTPPPALVPAAKKSSVKKVRFSIDNISFPTFDDTISSASNIPPSASPGARQSVGHDPLSSALNLFGNTRTRSIWDTPTSSGRPSLISPTRRTSDFESNLLKFSIMAHEPSPLAQAAAPSAVVTVEPRPVLEDDPMLLSGTSVPRTRRLSSLDDMESELLHSSSPPRRKMDTSDAVSRVSSPTSAPLSVRLGRVETPEELAELLDELFPSSALVSGDSSCWEEISAKKSVTSAQILNVVAQQFRSIELTLDSAIFQIDRPGVSCETLMRIENWREKFLEFFQSATNEAILTAKNVQLSVFANMVANLRPTMAVFEQLGSEWATKCASGQTLAGELRTTAAELAQVKAATESEFEAKFYVTESGEIERKRSLEEAKLAAVDRSILAAEAEIANCIDEINEVETQINFEQIRFSQDFKKLREFYFAHGWHVVVDGPELLLVFSVCWLFLFQRNKKLVRLEKIIPVKFQPPAPPHVSNILDEDFLVSEVLTASGLNFGASILLEPESFCYAMNAATNKLAEWMSFAQTLVNITADLGSLVTINLLNQIEVVMVVENMSLPVMVKLVWFDAIGTQISFDNFSFLLSDFVQSLFPALKGAIELALADIRGTADQLSFFESVLKTIHFVAQQHRNA